MRDILKEAIKEKLRKEARLNPLGAMRSMTGGLKSGMQKGYNALSQGYNKANVALGQGLTSPLGGQLMGDAGFMGTHSLLNQGLGSNLLPLGTMAQQGYSGLKSLIRR